jgi:hypothetical protein
VYAVELPVYAVELLYIAPSPGAVARTRAPQQRKVINGL